MDELCIHSERIVIITPEDVKLQINSTGEKYYDYKIDVSSADIILQMDLCGNVSVIKNRYGTISKEDNYFLIKHYEQMLGKKKVENCDNHYNRFDIMELN